MKRLLHNPYYRNLSIVLKASIIALIGLFLYRQVFVHHDVLTLSAYYAKMMSSPDTIPMLCLVLALMCVNWFLESIKWRMLISTMERVSILKSVQAVFTGIAVSIFTPNRIGEFGGRILVLEKADRVGAALVTILGSMSQLLITLLFGGIAMLYYFLYSQLLPSNVLYPVLIITPIILTALLYFYFRVDVLQKWMNAFAFTRKYAHHTEALAHFSTKQLASALVLSALRYITFTSQYLILLHVAAVNVDLFQATLMIVLTYLLLAIPALAFVELGSRILVAQEMLGTLSDNHLGIFTATSGLYFINVALPSVIGSFFILRLKFFRDGDE